MKTYFTKQGNKRHEYSASCDWLLDNGAISDEEANLLLSIRKERNFISHELPKILIDPHKEINIALLDKAIELIEKIDVWWIMNTHLPCNEGIKDTESISRKDVTSSRCILLKHIIALFLERFPGV